MDNTIKLAGYKIFEQIYAGSRTLVFSGVRESDQKPVIIKLMRNEYPSFNELVQFRNQYIISKSLDIEGIVKPLSLETYNNGYGLVMEDVGGVSLQNYFTETQTLSAKSLDEFLAIATQVTVILDAVHRHRIIHKDIKPGNILINPKTKQVKLIDFSIASLLPRETQQLQNPNVLEGTLAYISPEQTGRMNRGIDYRTDFYSLGVTFYELLTGQLPFTTKDPMELVHCHIAKQALFAHTVNPEIPTVISHIIAKLMAKNAEDRYQSALGLKYDLEICAQAWKDGSIELFELGQRDISERFIIPEKLYGREKEVEILLKAFERVANPTQDLLIDDKEEINKQSQIEMMLVTGFSGIGKTAVVNEIHKPIVRQHGYFIKGKYDQFQRHIPFSAFVQAFRDLMSQLLGESETQLQQWKQQILTALGDNGQVIIDVIPELEQIIGKQPPSAELAVSAAENRFNLLFQKFIQVFTTQEHPLVIFLDDLQWADSASLKLMQLLMTEINLGYMLMVGAYRDNEVSVAHPLMLTLEGIRKAGATINTINLSPLGINNLNNLVADSLRCSQDLALPLTELIYIKTKGNPFFSTQFLKFLYEDGLITFNFNTRHWECDITKVRELAITDDIIEFMTLQLQKLPLQTQERLKLAACIGNQFDLNNLSIVSEKSPAEIAADLWKALQEGLILPNNEVYKFFQDESATDLKDITNNQVNVSYKFLHDRVQQAAYSLIPENQKQATHLKIGRSLLLNTSDSQKEEKIFDIVNHLNSSTELINQTSEKQQLSYLNLLAGKKAKASTAYIAAQKYFTTGIELLQSNHWQEQYSLSFALHKEKAETEYLNGNFDASESLIFQIITEIQTNIEKALLYEILIIQYTLNAKYTDAINIGRKALSLLGVNLPETDLQAELDRNISEVNELLTGKEISSLVNLPAMEDEEKMIAAKLLVSIDPAAYIGKQELYPIVVLQLIILSLTYGNTSESAKGYVNYGILVGLFFQDYKSGYEFGKLSLALSDKSNDIALKCKNYFVFACFVNHWYKHIKEANKIVESAFELGLESGELQFSGYTVFGKILNLFSQGMNLSDISLELPAFLEFTKKSQNQAMIDSLTAFQIIIYNLSGMTSHHSEFCDSEITEKDYLVRCQSNQSLIAICCYHTYKAQVLYLYGDYENSFNSLQIAKEYIPYVLGFFVVALHNFYSSLTLVNLFRLENQKEVQSNYLQELQKNQDQMKIWSDSCQESFLHKYLLVEAEICQLFAKNTEAMELYDRAIALAKENGFVNEEALACELAAKFYLEWGKEKIAQAYLTDAYYAYARWGAKAKLNDLERYYPQLLSSIFLRQDNSISPTETVVLSSHTTDHTTTSTTSVFDLSTVIKAAQAISSEIYLDKLVAVLLEVVLENAGAKKGVLILLKDDKLCIEAVATVEENGKLINTDITRLPVESSMDIPISVIYYVKRSLQSLVVDDITKYTTWIGDSYIQREQPKSLLCLPILNQGRVIGLLYLENNLTIGAFTSDRVELLNLITSQAAISLQNAQLYQQAQDNAKQLEYSLQQLQQIQLQLVQSEKMSTLGNLVAGIAHEINNPVGFLAGNLEPARDYIQDLLELIDLYVKYYPDPVKEIQSKIQDIDLEYVQEDLPKLISSMREGIDRIYDMSISLRTFSRGDTQKRIFSNIHEGIDSTIFILKHRLKASETRPEIEIVKNYSDLPLVQCFPGQLNQVFMNLIANAIDALDESNTGRSFHDIAANPNRITVTTNLSKNQKDVLISIKDNGAGMTADVRQKIFDHLFTTKPVGKGTGLGLAIARQIVIEKHGGTIAVNSTPGEGAEFVIQIPVEMG